MDAGERTVAATAPLRFFCWDCGAPLALSVSTLRRDDVDPSCPVCDSLRLGVDYEQLVRWLDAVQKPPGPMYALRPTSASS
jgi:hypothetical protein